MFLLLSVCLHCHNTADCLSLVRELLSCNIPIYFEKENIDTGSMDSELILSMLSSMAQDESESISKNVKWSIQQRIEAGTFKFGYPPYGYAKDANGDLVIEPTEAEVIRLIFSSALNGIGTYKIAQMLESRGIPTRKGGKWSGSTIKGILVNEKYYGAAAFMKTYTDSSFRRHNNHGEVDSYYAEEHHEPIISREVFDKVQLVLQKHAEEHNIEADVGKYQNKYPFSGKIICGECGGKFKRQTQTTGIAWACTTHLYNKASCSMKFLKDAAVKAAFVTMLNKLIFGYQFILSPYLESLKLSDADNHLLSIMELKTALQKNTDRKQELRKLRVGGFLDSVMYMQELRRIEQQNEEYRATLKNQEKTAVNGSIKETEKLLHFIESLETQTEFSDEAFTEYVDSIIVYSRTRIGFRLKCGLTLKEELCSGTE